MKKSRCQGMAFFAIAVLVLMCTNPVAADVEFEKAPPSSTITNSYVRLSKTDDPGNDICGAALIADGHALTPPGQTSLFLTAAHCVSLMTPKNIFLSYTRPRTMKEIEKDGTMDPITLKFSVTAIHTAPQNSIEPPTGAMLRYQKLTPAMENQGNPQSDPPQSAKAETDFAVLEVKDESPKASRETAGLYTGSCPAGKLGLVMPHPTQGCWISLRPGSSVQTQTFRVTAVDRNTGTPWPGELFASRILTTKTMEISAMSADGNTFLIMRGYSGSPVFLNCGTEKSPDYRIISVISHPVDGSGLSSLLLPLTCLPSNLTWLENVKKQWAKR